MDRRLKFRQGLSRLYLPYYEGLCSLLGPEWQPYYGLRTFTEQNILYLQGRQTIGKIVTKANGGESPHNYGCATDWTWFDGPTLTWLDKDDPKWDVYVQAIEKVGLKAGKDFGDIDHNELEIACSWKHVHLAFNQNGMTFAQQKIEESMVQ